MYPIFTGEIYRNIWEINVIFLTSENNRNDVFSLARKYKGTTFVKNHKLSINIENLNRFNNLNNFKMYSYFCFIVEEQISHGSLYSW